MAKGKAKAKADRFNEGKPMLSLVPLAGMEAFARAGMFGLIKYSRDNWRKGLSMNELLDSTLRHAMALADPNESDIDPETGLNHADSMVWNAMVIAHAIKHGWED